MNNNTKTLVMVLFLVLVIAGAAWGYNALKGQDEILPENNQASSEGEGETETEEKIKAPDFTMLDKEGEEVKLSDFFGKPIVLNFWASWCPPCKAEMPHFQTVYNEYKDDVTFIMLNQTDGERETLDKAKTFIKNKEYTFPVYYDIKIKGGSIYGVRSIPTTLFIDKEGYIITGAQGSINEKTLKKGIEYIWTED